ncbi:L-2-amino-thiazoline-4-carboxylic acid hydrolase [Streptomyces mobaraensis]|uniref:Transcriptional regulator n=1 Tax=Streptomyces mobaraensis TaxID=35621 RepID=A0A5N5WA19_STRMB|nr:L-2-amino-thiazoline-4-carboxylic acid hydrolase [Streptomyces mobaraensis]KAB7847304.1 transcriptional regulator [Streptomyces mobaraensis]
MTDTTRTPSAPTAPTGPAAEGGDGADKRAQTRRMLGDRLRRYLELEAERGPEEAREVLLDGYPERQAARMGPLITGCSLAEGFGRALPRFAAMGFLEEAIDVSTDDEDVVMEVCRTCMCLTAAEDIGLSEPRPVLCELDFEATRRAFPEMSAESLRRQTDGHHVCVFRYARPRPAASDGPS